MEKWKKNIHSGQISETCTGTPLDLYRYTFGPVPVLPSRTEPALVQVRAVPVQVVFYFSISTSVSILAIT